MSNFNQFLLKLRLAVHRYFKESINNWKKISTLKNTFVMKSRYKKYFWKKFITIIETVKRKVPSWAISSWIDWWRQRWSIWVKRTSGWISVWGKWWSGSRWSWWSVPCGSARNPKWRNRHLVLSKTPPLCSCKHRYNTGLTQGKTKKRSHFN